MPSQTILKLYLH